MGEEYSSQERECYRNNAFLWIRMPTAMCVLAIGAPISAVLGKWYWRTDPHSNSKSASKMEIIIVSLAILEYHYCYSLDRNVDLLEHLARLFISPSLTDCFKKSEW